MPDGFCVDDTELQISHNEGLKTMHFCGSQSGLLYSHFTTIDDGLVGMSFRSVPKIEEVTPTLFQLEYRGNCIY